MVPKGGSNNQNLKLLSLDVIHKEKNMHGSILYQENVIDNEGVIKMYVPHWYGIGNYLWVTDW